jgi:hypothetical protein
MIAQETIFLSIFPEKIFPGQTNLAEERGRARVVLTEKRVFTDR